MFDLPRLCQGTTDPLLDIVEQYVTTLGEEEGHSPDYCKYSTGMASVYWQRPSEYCLCFPSV